MKKLHILRNLSFVALASTVACGAEPTDAEYDDLASALGAMAADDGASEAELAADLASVAEGSAPPLLGRGGSGVYEGSRGELAYRYAFACFDATGQAVLDCARAVSAEVEVDVEGTVETARRSGRFERALELTLTDLDRDVIVLDGTGRRSARARFSALRRTDERSWILDVTSVLEGVAFSRVDGQLRRGRITWEVLADRTRTTAFRTVEASLDVTAVLEITAPGEATLTLDGVRSYTVDLEEGQVSLRSPDAL